MLRQVRMYEKYTNAQGQFVDRPQAVFAFGTHPDVEKATNPTDLAHPVTAGRAMDNSFRIIMDELLVGNNLEEIECRGVVDTDVFDKVPVGATPDDIARCSQAKDVLPSACPASNPKSVCICKNDSGCLSGLDVIEKGKPVGVLDVNQDGTQDNTSFITDAVQIKCGSIMVPTDPNASYWYPSGDQNPPALAPDPFDQLGPAIVLHPGQPPGAPPDPPISALPTNTTCGLVFADSVVDKSGIKVCAPPDGNVDVDCTPGNTDAFSFKVEALSATPSSFTDMQTGIPRTAPMIFKFSSAVPLDKVTMGMQVLEGGTTALVAGTDYTIAMQSSTVARVTWTSATGLKPTQSYTVRFTTMLADWYNQPLPMMQQFTFTTGN